ncbi:cysteine rich protein [Cryptosporidium canis]|nr:cysteine rich protein [Cryptosporidium canis]
MGPKHRKSLSSISSQSYSDSPWKVLTRVELYQVLDQCDISVSSEKLLKGELIELLESNLDDKQCRKWLEHYEKPLPSPNFGLAKNEPTKKEPVVRERKSVPAYIAVANNNSDIINSIQGYNSNELSENRNLRRRNSMYTSNTEERAMECPRNTFEQMGIEQLNGHNYARSNDFLANDTTDYHNNHAISKKKEDENCLQPKQKMENRMNTPYNYIQTIILKIRSAPKSKASKIIFLVATIFIFFALYNHYYYFFHEPNFCNSTNLNNEIPNSKFCVRCPQNGQCRDGKLKCNVQYKKTIKYLNNKWQIVCVYDNEAFDLAEEMLTFITNKLRKLRGRHECTGNHLQDIFFPNKRKKNNSIDFDRSIVLSEKEINEIINLSFNYIEQNTVETALSIMWNSIKTGNSLSRYRLKMVEPPSTNSGQDLSTTYKHNSQSTEKECFIEALDSEASIICEAKIFIQKWMVIITGIIIMLLPPYLKITRRRRKAAITRKIKSIICRENRKDTVTGLFVGPDTETILRLLRVELPKYKKILNEELVKECCDYLEQNDPNIHKTLMSESRHPFYWFSG